MSSEYAESKREGPVIRSGGGVQSGSVTPISHLLRRRSGILPFLQRAQCPPLQAEHVGEQRPAPVHVWYRESPSPPMPWAARREPYGPPVHDCRTPGKCGKADHNSGRPHVNLRQRSAPPMGPPLFAQRSNVARRQASTRNYSLQTTNGFCSTCSRTVENAADGVTTVGSSARYRTE